MKDGFKGDDNLKLEFECLIGLDDPVRGDAFTPEAVQQIVDGLVGQPIVDRRGAHLTDPDPPEIGRVLSARADRVGVHVVGTVKAERRDVKTGVRVIEDVAVTQVTIDERKVP